MEVQNGMRWLTAKEAAQYVRMHPSTFWRYVREYKIPRRGPTNRHFSAEDLDRWMMDERCFLEDRAPARRQWSRVVV